MDHDRTAAPLTADEADARAQEILTEWARPTSYRDETTPPAYGPTPPVAQPGRPPMSQRATDASALMLSGSVAALSVGGATSLVLYTLGQVDPVTLAVGATGPVALVLAAGSLLKAVSRAKAEAAPTETHHHYNGTVRQETTTNVSSTSRGLFARTRNDVR
ncbi:hypothetical protein [Streptomyces sp. NPDC007007]|uniref:hypothetical protein n=1 Tax=Streptomyces sp. NPDC007007 TaxID=3364770 RepID=UPI00369E4470